jgi:hypothetical protein
MGIKMMLVKPLHFLGLRFESILPFHVAMAHQKQTSTIFQGFEGDEHPYSYVMMYNEHILR